MEDNPLENRHPIIISSWSRLIAVIITNRNFSNYPLKLVELLLSVISVVSGDSCA
jgi:hypothetical protein